MKYTLEEIEKMVDEMPECATKALAKKAVKLFDKAGIPKTTEIKTSTPTGRDTPISEQPFVLSDEEVALILKAQEERENGE